MAKQVLPEDSKKSKLKSLKKGAHLGVFKKREVPSSCVPPPVMRPLHNVENYYYKIQYKTKVACTLST